MVKLLWMTIDRHPESLRALIREQLAETGWEVFEVSYDSLQDIESIPLEEIDAVLLAPARHFPTTYMDRLTHCKIMQIWSSGYDKFNIEDAHDRGIIVANNHGSNAVSVAEHTILMLLGVSRRAPEMHDRVIAGTWAGNDHGMTSYSLSGKTLGIIGLGNIGTLVAMRAEALGMRIIFVDPGIEKSPNLAWERATFDHLCEVSDYISFHVHLGPETSNMINMKNLSLLERRPFIINVSRAELIAEDALIFALENGLVRGFALDAHYREPTALPDKLLEFPNSLFSPHIAGSTVDSYIETAQACLANISGALRGLPSKGRLIRAVNQDTSDSVDEK
jgi:D-3-phosphoglycerate dehydrogenase